MISSDSYHEIGSGHVFCQDYADNGSFTNEDKTNIYNYAIVCDGCSGSKDSNVGALWFAKNFPRFAKKVLASGGLTEESLRKVIVAEISVGMEQMNVPELAFDATIVALIYDQLNDILYSFVWGDGKVFYKFKNGKSGYLTDIGYPSNAPFYLTYRRNIERELRYEDHFGNAYADILDFNITEESTITLPETYKGKQKFHYEVFVEASKSLLFASVFTDGVDTYHKIDDSDILMPRHNIFNQLTQYKNLHGEFVKRRMQSVKKFCQKEGWQHFDDISVSTLAFH